MAENAKKPEGGDEGDKSPKKKPPILMLAIVGVLMLVEAGAVYAVVSMTGGGAGSAKAAEVETETSDENELVEIELIDEQFQNLQSGRVWEWQVQIFLKVRKKNLDGPRGVKATLERRNAEIKEGIALIFRRAQHRNLQEPGLQTIHRQVTAYVNEVFGQDADGNDKVERVLIPSCKGFEI
ncbi:MAG: hypothetical protein R3B57_12155 [Phycisphaerales bacterium]